jgi:hypothetical protein
MNKNESYELQNIIARMNTRLQIAQDALGLVKQDLYSLANLPLVKFKGEKWDGITRKWTKK